MDFTKHTWLCAIAPAKGALRPQVAKLFANPEAAAAEGTFEAQLLYVEYPV